MSQKILLVEDNTAPNIVITLKRDGSAIDLTSASSVELFINKDGVITNTGHTSCTITTPASGIVTYTPQAADFATAASYQAEVKITYADASVETVYEKFTIKARTKLSA